ncbi:MAG: transketolase-like TK C-terminal-containing protein, partial [Christensenellales bacterium]
HAMAGVCNGVALFGGINAVCSCYLSFADYLKPSLRMTAMMNLPVLYEFSHDNFLIGEDGPTHQPVEQLVMLRATPNMTVFRPYNLSEVLACYKFYLSTQKPTTIVLSKEKVDETVTNIDDCLKGGYVVFEAIEEVKAVILTSGIETKFALSVAKQLKNIRVVSMPCFELFDQQTEKYKQKILTEKPKIALEFLSSYSYYKYVKDGLYLCMDSFGKSGKGKDVQKSFKLDIESMISKIKKFLKKFE